MAAIMIALGFLMLAAGVLLGGTYVVGAVAVLGESDRSWLFWGVALLFIGIILARLGVRLIAAGRNATSRVGARVRGSAGSRRAGRAGRH